MIKKKMTQQGVKGFLFIGGLLLAGWILYLSKFYLFYREAYFYVDKRITLFLQLLSFLNNNWVESIGYFIFSFVLFVALFFLIGGLYFLKKRRYINPILAYLFYGVAVVISFSFLFTILWSVFLIIILLSISVVYMTFVLSLNMAKKEDIEDIYEEDDVIEIIGPFDTEKKTQEGAQQFLDRFSDKNTITLDLEIYLDENKHYYAEIYVKASHSNESHK